MTGNETVAVSVVIAARNEAANIVACIESVRWASEILVVEDGSTDATIALAEAAGATVTHNAFTTIGAQRNAAIARAHNEWILVVDADERASPAVRDEVREIIARPTHAAYRVPRRNFFLGTEVKHGGWEHDRPVRLFKREHSYNASRVHEHVDVTGAAGEMRSALTHEPYRTIDSYFDKLDRYSRWWAQDRHERGKRAGASTVALRPPLRFLTMLFVRGGILDGGAGVVLASMAATSVMAKYARLWSMSRNGEGESRESEAATPE